jgi:hypothetical protein
MDENKDQRKAERIKCNAPVKIAYYVPIEYEACYGPGCFLSTIVDYSENGFGVIMENALAENTVVNIFTDRKCKYEENSPVDKVYQSKVKWIKTNQENDSGPFRIGVQHIS